MKVRRITNYTVRERQNFKSKATH